MSLEEKITNHIKSNYQNNDLHLSLLGTSSRLSQDRVLYVAVLQQVRLLCRVGHLGKVLNHISCIVTRIKQNPNHQSIMLYLDFEQDRTKTRRTHNQPKTKTTLSQVNDLD